METHRAARLRKELILRHELPSASKERAKAAEENADYLVAALEYENAEAACKIHSLIDSTLKGNIARCWAIHRELRYLVGMIDKEYGVGKRMGNCVYMHRQATGILLHTGMREASSRLPADFMWNVLKYDKKSGAFSFMWSPDFSTADEPCILSSCLVPVSRNIVMRDYSYSNPKIYHWRWMFTSEDTKLFDYKESMRRSASWYMINGARAHTSRMGNKKYWVEHCIPLLEQTGPI
jgi:hypothetical protein